MLYMNRKEGNKGGAGAQPGKGIDDLGVRLI